MLGVPVRGGADRGSSDASLLCNFGCTVWSQRQKTCNRGCTLCCTVAVVADPPEWVLLAYRLPREPSTPRITVWRKLRKLGVAQLVDGLVALPASARSREQFDWLADEVVEAGGEAWTWTAVPGSKEQQRLLAARMSEATAAEYQAVLEEADEVASQSVPARRTVQRLRRELRRIEARDHFPPKERQRARRAIERLTAMMDAADEESLR